MQIKHKWIIPLLLLVTIGLVGCSSTNGKSQGSKTGPQSQQEKQILSGTYKENENDSKLDDGTEQPSYIHFTKDGKVLIATPETGDEDSGYYGAADRGTWKASGNDKYKLKIHDIYDKDYYTLELKKNGNNFTMKSTDNKAKYVWSKDGYSKIDMTYSDFMDMFNKAKDSDQKKIQENGYAKPDNDSSSNSSNSSSSSSDSDSSSTSADPDEIGKAVYARVFPSEQVDSVEQDGDSYYVSNEYHSADSTVEFQINGDKVTYWTQADGDTTADGKNDAHTVSIKDLLGN